MKMIYRILLHGEVVAKGDEILDELSNVWRPAIFTIGVVVNKKRQTLYRRPIKEKKKKAKKKLYSRKTRAHKKGTNK